MVRQLGYSIKFIFYKIEKGNLLLSGHKVLLTYSMEAIILALVKSLNPPV
jgi:hypothetical protein